ncbi:hypothetical protein QUF64_11505 [Anaerolineales bacterium HSG6]|nr:hypothetical protein [Anaerolineales bacterium HSG6]MDM8531604.1 hypothetical protein [Anaerolineales bacterium HSG25]
MKKLTKLLNQLEEEELAQLCQDHFPDLSETFIESTSHVDMRHKLINFADPQVLAEVLAHHPSISSDVFDEPIVEDKKEGNMPKILAVVALMAMLFSVLAPFTGSIFETIGALFN